MEVQDCKIRFANGEAADICGRLLLAKSVEELCIRKFAEYLEVERFKLADNTGKSVELMLAVDGVYAYWNGVNDWTAVQGERPFEAHMSDEFMSFWIDSVTADPELRSNVSFNVDDEMDIEFGWNALAERIRWLLVTWAYDLRDDASRCTYFQSFKERCIKLQGVFPAVSLEWRAFAPGSVESIPGRGEGIFAKLREVEDEMAEGWLSWPVLNDTGSTVTFALIPNDKSEPMYHVYFEMEEGTKTLKDPRWENVFTVLENFVVETLHIPKCRQTKFFEGFAKCLHDGDAFLSKTFRSEALMSVTLAARLRVHEPLPVLQGGYIDGNDVNPFFIDGSSWREPNAGSCDLLASGTEHNSVLEIEGWLHVEGLLRSVVPYIAPRTSRVTVIVTFDSDMNVVSLKSTAAPTKITESLQEFLSTFKEAKGYAQIIFVAGKDTVGFSARIRKSGTLKVYVGYWIGNTLQASFYLDHSSWGTNETNGKVVVHIEGANAFDQAQGRIVLEMTFEKMISSQQKEKLLSVKVNP
eukprot:GHVS01067366.1.p1 GENE.GHVS01067366.1~~GHVS01067366.1.p1  ORF type:complete len:538 (+),score=41.58 GHVS01067366.1:45-1616(+)